MKKFLALMFALIFALSAATTAFAAANTCPYCGIEIATEKEYNKHLKTDCPKLSHAADNVVTQYCPYEGCTAKFKDPKQYEAHLEECDFKKETNRDKVEGFFENLELSDITKTVTDLLAKINFSDLAVKAIELIEKAVLAIVDLI